MLEVFWTNLAQDSGVWRALVKTVNKLRPLQTTMDFLPLSVLSVLEKYSPPWSYLVSKLNLTGVHGDCN
jgi:hypothetical protein